MRWKRVFGIAATALLAAGAAAAGGLRVGSGGSLDLGTGSLDLRCSDLTVGGTLSAGTVGLSAARDVTIDPSGTLKGESATLVVAGDWDNAGSFVAGTSTVQLVDGCGLLGGVISGNTTFNDLEITTSTGEIYQLEAGSTQTVTGSLTLLGALSNLLGIRSTVEGVAAFLDAQGSQNVDYVDVQDNQAVGNPIVLAANSVKGTNSPGWNVLSAVPALGVLGLLALAGSLLATGRRRLQTRA